MKILLLTIPLILAIGPFASPEDLVKKGNDLYSEKKYDEALSYYRRAEDKVRNKAPVIYNMGNTLLRRNDIPGAIREYRKSASIADGVDVNDGKLKAMSLYNLGNALFVDGKYKEAAGAYKEAIKYDPSDIDAKVNLEITLNRMEEEKRKEAGKKEGQDKKDEEKKKNDSKDNQEEADKSGGEDKKQDGKDKPGEEQNKDKEKQDSGKKEDDGRSNEKMNREEADGGLKAGEMTREEAERIINNMGDGNMNLQFMTDMVKGAPSGAVKKDW